MHPAPVVHIPQPCHESWAAMTPATQGRHCAACQKTVVDFTLKTDAEILALLASAAGGRTCGRFAAGQLERPLQRAVPAAPMPARWRTWLAAAAALWAVREGVGTPTKAQTPAEWRARYGGGPVPAAPPAEATGTTTVPTDNLPTLGQEIMGDTLMVANPVTPRSGSRAAVEPVLRGIVTDAATNQGVPGVTILVKDTKWGVSTNADGSFELKLPAELRDKGKLAVQVSSIGYLTQQRTLPAAEVATMQRFQLQADTTMMGEIVITTFYRKMPPAPWHPRRFYNWGKFWLTRPFRRD